MMDRTHDLPVSRQARALSLARSTVYSRPRPVSAEALALMRRVVELRALLRSWIDAAAGCRVKLVCRGLGERPGPSGSCGAVSILLYGLLIPGERKSVEPITARVEPRGVQRAHQSLHHFVANAGWPDEALLRQLRADVVPVIEIGGRVRAWTVDDTGCPVGARVLSAWRDNTAANSASRTIARLLCRFPSPVSMQACQSRFGCTCRNTGLLIRFGVQGPARLRRSGSRRSGGSRSTRSAPRAPKACPKGSCWPTRDTGTTQSLAMRSRDGPAIRRRRPIVGSAMGAGNGSIGAHGVERTGAAANLGVSGILCARP